MILESEKSEFLRILNELKVKRADFCTQKEMAEYLKTSKQLIFDLYCA